MHGVTLSLNSPNSGCTYFYSLWRCDVLILRSICSAHLLPLPVTQSGHRRPKFKIKSINRTKPTDHKINHQTKQEISIDIVYWQPHPSWVLLPSTTSLEELFLPYYSSPPPLNHKISRHFCHKPKAASLPPWLPPWLPRRNRQLSPPSLQLSALLQSLPKIRQLSLLQSLLRSLPKIRQLTLPDLPLPLLAPCHIPCRTIHCHSRSLPRWWRQRQRRQRRRSQRQASEINQMLLLLA